MPACNRAAPAARSTGVSPDARPSPPLPTDAERAYLCRRLDRLNGLIAVLEAGAAAATGPAAEELAARAGKHRERAGRIRAHLRSLGA